MTVMFRSFVTRGVYVDYAAFRRVIISEFTTRIGPDLVALHDETVAHWKEAPSFVAGLAISASGIEVNVQPRGRPATLWWYHSDGVEGRTIRPKRHRQPRYHVKSKGRRRKPRSAALKFKARSGEMLFRNSVWWPGITAREHPKRIADAYNVTFRRHIENAVKRAVRAAQAA